VFAAKLSYGCPHYAQSRNFNESPDIEEGCQFEDSDVVEPFIFTGYGVRIKFAFDQDDLMENIPFKSGDDVIDSRQFCKSFINSLHEDLAYVMEIPPTFLKVSKRSEKKCKKNGAMKFDFAFHTNPSEHYSAVVPHGDPKDWVEDRIKMSTKLENNYLLKEYKKLSVLDGLEESNY